MVVVDRLKCLNLIFVHSQLDRTAVHIAAERGFSGIVEYLVDKVKVDVNFRSKVSVFITLKIKIDWR